MIDSLLLNPATQKALKAYLNQPAHALIISGESGAGKLTIARAIASNIFKISSAAKLTNQPYYHEITAVNNSISIETVRSLQNFLKLRTPGIETIRRIVVIENAHSLTKEAQNALLKTLEEPPADTVIILTVADGNKLLPTILSRAQNIKVQRPILTGALSYFQKDSLSQGQIERNYMLSDGQVGLLSELLTKNDHPLASKIALAKELLKADLFTRLGTAEQLIKDKDSLALLLSALEKVCHAALVNSVNNDRAGDTKNWHKRLELIDKAQKSLKASVQTKLLVTNLMLHI